MRIITILITPLLLASLAVFARAEGFTALAAPYPPYCVSNGLAVKGISISALNTIMEMCGTPLGDNSLKLTPWAFGYERTARLPRHILVNAKRTPTTESLYKWVGPVATSRIVLIGRKRDGHFIRSRSALKKYRIAAVRWSRPEKALISGGFAKTDFVRTPTHVNSLRMLDKGEVDLFATTERGAPCLLEGLGMNLAEYAVYHVLEEEPLYFAFSKDTDDQLIFRLNAALRNLKYKPEHRLSRLDRMIYSFSISMK